MFSTNKLEHKNIAQILSQLEKEKFLAPFLAFALLNDGYGYGRHIELNIIIYNHVIICGGGFLYLRSGTEMAKICIGVRFV